MKSWIQWRIQGRGPGAREPLPPVFLDQTENIFFGDRAKTLSKGLDDRPPHPPRLHLKVWIRQCYLPPKLLQYVTYAVTGFAVMVERRQGGINWNTFFFSKYINSHDSFIGKFSMNL